MELVSEWEDAEMESPQVKFAFDPQSEELFLVIEDDSTIYRLVNSAGTIYVIAGFRCSLSSSPDFLDGIKYYNIDNPILHVVSCGTVNSERDRFAIDLAKLYLE